MKNNIKTLMAGLFVTAALPFVLVLLLNGRQRIHQEKPLDEIDYTVLNQMLAEDVSWMSDDTLKLLAVLYRTEEMRLETLDVEQSAEASTEPARQTETYGKRYERIYQAVEDTAGMVVTIDGTYKELPFHKISAGKTRDGSLLGESYSYVRSVECREDKEAQDYLQICTLSMEEMLRVLEEDDEREDSVDRQAMLQKILLDDFTFQRDSEGYVESVSLGNHTWTGEAFRTLLHLPSSCFWMDREQSEENSLMDGESGKTEKIRVTVKGVGHGFGISLYTADRWIREGKSWQDIFSIFYENAQCITIP